MPDNQQILEYLKQLQVEDWREKQYSAVSSLPADLQPIAYQLLGYNTQGKPYGKPYTPAETSYTQNMQGQKQATQQLTVISADKRQQVFHVLAPAIAPYLEAGWQLLEQGPYPTGNFRRAFRAINRPDLFVNQRQLWLTSVIHLSNFYGGKDTIWLAEWAAYAGRYSGAVHLGILFAAAINTGDATGSQVYDILIASANGEHETGMMGRHIPQALLTASRPEGWEYVERLLLAAQRQEGLRQLILEMVDVAHPQAFRRMVHLITEQNLTRFSSVVRALDVWLGLGWVSADSRAVQKTMVVLDTLLQDETAHTAVLQNNDPEQVYLALWVKAFENAETAVPSATAFLSHPQTELRFVATYLLAQLALPEADAALLPMLLDDDLRVAATALSRLQFAEHPHLFETLETALPRFPKSKKTLSPLVWPWLELTAEQRTVAHALVKTLGERPLSHLLPYLPLMDVWQRAKLVTRLKEENQKGSPLAREVLLKLLGDPGEYVRKVALEATAELTLTPAEAKQLEGFLTRKSADLRQGILKLLLNQKDKTAVSSLERLLNAKTPLQNQAGIELLKQLQAQNRAAAHRQTIVQTYAARYPELAELETPAQKPETATLENGLGLFDPSQRSKPIAPQSKKGWFGKGSVFTSPASTACLKSLDDLIHQHAATPIVWKRGDSEHEELLGNVRWSFPEPNYKEPIEQDVTRLPLREVWEVWWRERPSDLRDADGFELLRAVATPPYPRMRVTASDWVKSIFQGVGENTLQTYRYPALIPPILWWLLRLHPPTQLVNFVLDAIEHNFSLLPATVKSLEEARTETRWMQWLSVARTSYAYWPQEWTKDHHIRFWRLLHWLDEPQAKVSRYRPHMDEVMRAYYAEDATQADILDQLIGDRETEGYWGANFKDLRQLSGRKPNTTHSDFATDPQLQGFIAQIRRRIVEIESQRGDMATAASQPALALRYTGGLESLLPLLQALGKDGFVRGWIYSDTGKSAVFSHLIRATYPTETDTPERFAEGVKKAKISQTRLVETAVYAPQWAKHIEHALGWPSFAEAVWWFHAHTKDNQWRVDQEIREAWNAETAERTPLTGAELVDGAVDVAWFNRVYAALGQKRWDELDKAAKYSSGGNGHTRARLFADAMLGRVTREELSKRIKEKRNQDALRGIGLLPLPENGRADEILSRYLLIQEFLRGVKQFGSQRQASEKLAAKIALENLARTAGFADPLRLEWAMERHAIADLADGPVTATAGEVAVTLAIDAWGEAEVTVTKNGRSLKTVPPAVKKQPDVAALFERKTAIKRQLSRARQSLEQAMCRGDVFTGGELQELLTHPVLRPLLQQLVFMGDRVMGYPVEQGRVLVGINGRKQPITADTPLTLAHPYDLLATAEWHTWQAECFRQERIQPFKQIFRELYILTPAEKETGTFSRRYAGQQVNPRQAMALFGSRGWVFHPEEGVKRTFHDENLTAWVGSLGGWYTPAEMEGLTIETIYFTRRGDWHPLSLEDIPARLFSEVMRDLDLVVSVAHQGGVDPEATASTTEMRASLIRETCQMLKINNVRLQSRHALIEGDLNHYSVHLGSGVVHQQPGGYVCIVPVHSQHRGRLFLPFADDDPKTAEIISKILLLAKDKQIKDPTILEQILPRA